MFDLQRQAEDKEQKETIKVCPTAEDLQWKPPNVGGRFVCPAQGCGMVTNTQGGLSQHINSNHPKLSRTGGKILKGLQKVQYHCPENTCVYNPDSERYFNTFEQLKAHYASQHWEKRHVCQKCGKKFGLERDWRRHEAICGTVFSCGSCDASYPSRQALLVHCRRKQHPVPEAFHIAKKNSATKPNTGAATTVSSATTASSSQVDGQIQTSCTSPGRAGSKSIAKNIKLNQSQDVINDSSSTSCPQSQPEGTQTLDNSPVKVSRPSKTSKNASASKASPRPILPKSLLPTVVHVFDASTSPQASRFLCSQGSTSQSSAGIQTDISGITPLYQRLSQVGVSSGCQTVGGLPADSWSVQNHRQVAVVNMATQVSVPFTESASNPQISDMATQASVTLVNSSTQIADDPFDSDAAKQAVSVENAGTQASTGRSSMGTQMDSVPPVASAAVQTSQLASVANMATQATVFCVDNGTQLFLKTPFMQPAQMIDSSSQALGPSMTMRNSTNTQGTQIFFSQILPEAAQMSTTGMQTSVSLLPCRQRRRRTIAQTQTSGDKILRSAMVMANLPVTETAGRSPRGTSRSPGRKRNVRSSEVQTNATLPQKRPRKGRNKSPSSTATVAVPAQMTTQETSSKRESAARELLESLISDDENVLSRQNPTLSSSAGVDEDLSETDLQFPDLLAKSPPPQISTSDTSMQVDFEDFLSSYTTDLAVQTQDDFIAACTADFGAQTQDDLFGVGTADFGVQTSATSFGSFLEELKISVGCSAKVDEAVFDQPHSMSGQSLDMSARSVPTVDCGIGTDTSLLDTHTQTALPSGRNLKQLPIPSPLPSNPDLSMADTHTQTVSQPASTGVDSASEAASTFSDCATCTDLFVTSSHTQTSQVQDFEDWALDFQLDESHSTPVLSFSHSNNPVTNPHERDNNWGLPSSAGALSNESAKTSAHAPCKSSTATSTFSSSVDFGAGTATDMHTQTADDLLEFLMTNMETQTTEDVFTHSLDLTDIQTQTSDALVIPPRPSSQNRSPYSGQAFSFVSAETQTSSPRFCGGGADSDDLSHFTDMQTQTGFDILDICTSPTTSSGSQTHKSYPPASADTGKSSPSIHFNFDGF